MKTPMQELIDHLEKWMLDDKHVQDNPMKYEEYMVQHANQMVSVKRDFVILCESLLEKEKEILRAQALESGKPADIVEKMLTGRVRKYLAEITLQGQPYVKNPDITVETLLSDAGAKVNRFVRYEVGEGIEKKQENFADEVMAQVNG